MKKNLFGILIIALCTLGLTSFALAGNRLANPGFETWTAGPAGPPDNWVLSHDDTTLLAIQEAVTVHGGTYSVALTCSSTSTRRLEQHTVPVTPDSCYQFSFWAWDNDPYGRASPNIRWYDDTDTNLIGGYYGDYTSDMASWQLITTGPQKALAGAAYAHCEIRIYDVDWGDTVFATTLYFDDAFFDSITCLPEPDILTIPEIQYNISTPGSGNDCYPSPEDGNVIYTGGIVTAISSNAYSGSYWLQDSDSLWSGIYAFDFHTVALGDSVFLKGEVDEYYGVSEVKNLEEFTIVSSGHTLPDPIDITPGDLAKSYLAGCDVDAEPYEGLLCKLTNVICVVDSGGVPHDYAAFYVSDFSFTDTCQIENYIYAFGNYPAVGDTFLSITGIVHYSRDEYELNPRSAADIVWKHPPRPPGPTIAGISHTPTVPNPATPVKVMASIFDNSTSVANDSVFYQVNDTQGAWTAVEGDSVSSNYYYFTIPGQSDLDTVFFYVYAENDSGGITTSPTHKYLVLDEIPQIKINEFTYDSPGTDKGSFIELHGPSALSLAGWSLALVNGNNGQDVLTINLTGSIPGDGYFVVAQDTNVANRDTIVSAMDPLNFQNGPDNVHLRKDGFL